MTIQHPIVLVTGCTPGGMGHTLALEFASQGCRVIATARRPAVLASVVTCEKLSALQPGEIAGVELDVTDSASIKKAVSEIKSALGTVHILWNNAGMGCSHPTVETDMERVKKIFQTNVFGLLELTQAVVPMMIEQGSGKIINTGSISADATTPWSGVYSASKGAVHQLTQAMRMELHPFGIQVCTVKPGSIATNISQAHLGTALSDDSVYKNFKGSIEKRGAHIDPNSTTPQEFARAVVPKVLHSDLPPEFSYGHKSTLFYYLTYLPVSWRNYLFSRHFDLL